MPEPENDNDARDNLFAHLDGIADCIDTLYSGLMGDGDQPSAQPQSMLDALTRLSRSADRIADALERLANLAEHRS